MHVTDEFPMTVTGKVQKYMMREQAIELLDLDRPPALGAGVRAGVQAGEPPAPTPRGDGQRDGMAAARRAAAIATGVVEPPDDERGRDCRRGAVERAPEVRVVDEAARAIARQPRLLVDGSSGLDRDEVVVEEARQQRDVAPELGMHPRVDEPVDDGRVQSSSDGAAGTRR